MNFFKLIIDMLLLYRPEDAHNERKERFVAADSAELIKVIDPIKVTDLHSRKPQHCGAGLD